MLFQSFVTGTACAPQTDRNHLKYRTVDQSQLYPGNSGLCCIVLQPALMPLNPQADEPGKNQGRVCGEERDACSSLSLQR